MQKCEPYNKFKYRLYEHYFGKFEDVNAICDFADLDNANRVLNILSEYYKERPFSFFLREVM